MSSERPTNYQGNPGTLEQGASAGASSENTRRMIEHSSLLLPSILSGEESNFHNSSNNNNVASFNHRYDVTAAPMDYNIAQAWISSAPSNQNNDDGLQTEGLEDFQDEFADSVQGDNNNNKKAQKLRYALPGLRKNLFSSSGVQLAQQSDREGNSQVQLGWSGASNHHQQQQQYEETGQHHVVEQYSQFDSWLAQNEADGTSTPPVSLPSTPPSIPDDLMNLSYSSSNSNHQNNNPARHSYGPSPISCSDDNQDEKKDDGSPYQDASGSFKAVASPGEIEEPPFQWMRNPQGSIPDEIVLDDDRQANMEDELLTGDGGENSINIHNKIEKNPRLFRSLGASLSRPAAIRSEDRQVTPNSWHTPISMLPRAHAYRNTSGGSSRRAGSVPLSPGSRRSTKSEKYYHSYQTNIGAQPKPVPPFVVVHKSGSAVVTVTPKRTAVVPASKPVTKRLRNNKKKMTAMATVAAAEVDLDLDPIIAEESIRSGKEANCGCDGEEAKVWCRIWGRPVTTALASAIFALALITVVTSLVSSRFQRKQPEKQQQLRPQVSEPTQSPMVFPTIGLPNLVNSTDNDLDALLDGDVILRPYEGTRNPAALRPTAPPRTLPPTFAPSMLPDNFPDYVPTSAPFLQESDEDLGFSEDEPLLQIPWNNYVLGLLSVESPNTFTSFDNPRTPQFMALQWISVDSSRKGGSIAYTMDASLQRFALATVYFSLGGEDDWLERDGWLSAVVPVCDWKGITCDSSNTAVLSLDLASNNLSGTLPEELKLLKYLQVLNFPENSISGSLPSEYSILYELVEFNLSENSLTGSIPEEYGGAGAFELLEVLDVSHNSIQGEIPSHLENLQSLEIIRICSNSMTGMIPSALGSLKALNSINLGNNDFTGDFPGAICDSTSDVVIDCTVGCECCTSCCDGEDCC